MSFAGTEHYRERAAFLRKHEPMVYHRPYRIDLEALCDHIEDLQKKNEQAWERAALEARRVLKNGSKARKLEQENAELREELRKTSAVADSLLQERMIAKDLQGKYTAGPGTDGKDIIVCERCGRYVTEQVEGVLETRSVWEQENAELRKRVESFEMALEFYGDENIYRHPSWLLPQGEETQSEVDRGYTARAALSQANAKAKLETRSEEEK